MKMSSMTRAASTSLTSALRSPSERLLISTSNSVGANRAVIFCNCARSGTLVASCSPADAMTEPIIIIKARKARARDGSSRCRVSRGANALVLLDKGWSCQQVADALLLDDDTIRGWRKLFEQRGIEGITSFDVGGSASYLSVKQEDDLKAWVGAALPRSTRQIGAWIEKEFGLVYESRSGLIALLHRLGLEYHKPNVIPRKLNEEKQKAFIASYDNLLNSLTDNEAVLDRKS